MSANARVRAVYSHLHPSTVAVAHKPCAAQDPKKAKTGVISGPIECDRFPAHRHEALKWNGWGYNGTNFFLDEEGQVAFRGEKYALNGFTLPLLRDYMTSKLSLDMANPYPFQKDIPAIPASILNPDFIKEVEEKFGETSTADIDRLFRAHGQTLEESFALTHGTFKRVPDFVIWPESHAHCEGIVKAACRHNVVIIPFGGGTTVTDAVRCPEHETRMIVSLDTSKMNRILVIDKDNMVARMECGIVGAALERKLEEYGVTTGHEPDSIEFSTVGGWVATRASGFKKNIYGNIEDMLISVKIVTPKGTIEKSCMVPRISAGPDIHQFILGSEGTLGVVTEVTLKIREVPEKRVYGSLVFPTFEDGVKCLRELAKIRAAPASIRLTDNEQFQLGRTLKPSNISMIEHFVDSLKTFYVTKVKGFVPTDLTVATLLFEGSESSVEAQQKKVFEVAAKYRGISGGEENGKRGYLLTYNIAYLRDIALEYRFLSESFETSVPWDSVVKLARNTKDRLHAECKKRGVKGTPLASCRVTQTYDSGACVYFYFGFLMDGIKDPVHTYHEIESAARDEILANGGSISHHHGIGKIRKQWVVKTLSQPGVEMIRAVKKTMDPQNIFGSGNLID